MQMAKGRLFAPCYHMVSDHHPEHVQHLYSWRGTKAFEKDLEYLSRHFTPLSLAELYRLITECRPLPERPLFLSFDDGFREMSEIVAPLCHAKGMPATFFLTTSFLDNRNLGFRHKASVLIGRCEKLPASRRHALLDRWARDRGLPAEQVSEFRSFLGAIRYQDRSLLDDLAKSLEVDFGDYLRAERPYMIGEQVEGLLAKGFSIGGHSVDHPLYSDLPLNEQIEQTERSLMELVARFQPAVRAFAFPFVSDGVTEAFYREVFSKNIVDLVFCIGAMSREHPQRTLQRFGVESKDQLSLDQHLRQQVSRDIKSRVLAWAGKPQSVASEIPAVTRTAKSKPDPPLVSILIPAYNAESWIRQSIESALTQTYSPKEVIVVDDGSTDGTAEIVRSFGDRIRFEARPHAGGNAARNVLLELAQGEWLQYLDADDYLLPNKLLDQMRFAEESEFQFDVVYSPYLVRDEATRKGVIVGPKTGHSATQHFLSWVGFWTGALLLRRSAVKEVGGWKEDQPCCQEHELLLRLIREQKKFGLWNEVRAVYRNHGTTTVSRKAPLRTIRVRMDLTNQCVEFLGQNGALTADHQRLLYIARMESARSAWPLDRPYSCELAQKALEAGRWWNTESPALPLRFLLASFALGFEQAQSLAERRRARAARQESAAETGNSTSKVDQPDRAPLVSILIPAYNAEKWIRQSIESALGQIYSPKEVIVVDDGSNDSTVAVIRGFGDRIRFVQLADGGGNAARNALLKLAKGEWLQYLDADDYLLPNKIADQMRVVAEQKNEIDVVYSPFLIRRESKCTHQASSTALGSDVASHYIFWTAFCTHGVLLRRSAVNEVQGWDEAQMVCQEHELLLRLLGAGKRFVQWSEPAAVYRYHDTGTVSRKDPFRTVRMRMELTDRCEHFLRESRGLTATQRRALFIARMESARSVWPIDRGYANQLVRKALSTGHRWISGSPALPAHFQLAMWLLGFDLAQRLAGFRRRLGAIPPAGEDSGA
jgi:glycosyltransferase involved in cell wall biosynthesis/peptidoglycan/xylan/chitin deacetylase (PgdA/CDA1 family)